MKQTPTCHPCVERQVLRVLDVALAQPDAPALDPKQRKAMERELVEQTREWLAVQPLDLSPAELSFGPIKMVYAKTGVFDPYRELKDRSNQEALALLPELRTWIRESSNPLETAAHMAVAGNIIDLGIHKDYDIHESIRRILDEGFVIDDMARFVSDLKDREASGETPEVLYICDNAGEIAFDRLFIETLIAQFPRTRFTATVNSGPVLNDALMEDAEAVGLVEIVPVIENGYDLLGTVLPECSPEFREAFDRADWVISKGQANFETLDGVSDKVLFLLKAKCEPIAGHVGITIHQGVFKQSDNHRSPTSNSLAAAACPTER
jgi:hypothetical protein